MNGCATTEIWKYVRVRTTRRYEGCASVRNNKKNQKKNNAVSCIVKNNVAGMKKPIKIDSRCKDYDENFTVGNRIAFGGKMRKRPPI